MKTPNPDAETNESILISGVNQLNPKKKTGVEPHADNNVLNVTNHCLYALTSTDRESTGRTSGAWWFIWMIVFMTYLLGYTFYNHYQRGGVDYNWVEDLAIGGGASSFYNIHHSVLRPLATSFTDLF